MSLDGEGYITTEQGSYTFSERFGATTSRRTQRVQFPERRLQSDCEKGLEEWVQDWANYLILLASACESTTYHDQYKELCVAPKPSAAEIRATCKRSCGECGPKPDLLFHKVKY